MHEHPFSGQLARVLSKLRKNPRVAPELRGDFIESLVAFYNAEQKRKRSEPAPLAQTLNKTRRYLKNFNLVVPFERRALDRIWRACDTPPCEEPRLNLEARIGPLDLSPPRLPNS